MSAAELRLAAMRLARAEAEDHLTQALEMASEPLDEKTTPKQLDQTHRLISGYVQLAGVALEQFEEAARGA